MCKIAKKKLELYHEKRERKGISLLSGDLNEVTFLNKKKKKFLE